MSPLAHPSSDFVLSFREHGRFGSSLYLFLISSAIKERYNGSLAAAVAIAGAVATDSDAANENTDTIGGFSGYSTSDSDDDSQATNGEVGGGGGTNKGVGGRLEGAVFQAPLLGVQYLVFNGAIPGRSY